jgi:hypothetical protein
LRRPWGIQQIEVVQISPLIVFAAFNLNDGSEAVEHIGEFYTAKD